MAPPIKSAFQLAKRKPVLATSPVWLSAVTPYFPDILGMVTIDREASHRRAHSAPDINQAPVDAGLPPVASTERPKPWKSRKSTGSESNTEPYPWASTLNTPAPRRSAPRISQTWY